MKKRTNPPSILESPDIVAFVLLNQNIQPRPYQRQSDQKVIFEFTEDIGPSIDAFYRNVPVPVGDFCKNLKFVRSMIFNLKRGAGDVRR
jgi:hypothetical protein